MLKIHVAGFCVESVGWLKSALYRVGDSAVFILSTLCLFKFPTDKQVTFELVMQKDWTQKTIDEGMHLPFVFLAYAGFGSFLVLISSCLVLFWAPAAAGGGVS